MELLNKFNIPYKNIELYERAFTHTSFANENNCKSYERLEFLGDAVLEIVISEYVYKNDKYEEGMMTKLRSHYVCENALYIYSTTLGLDKYIKFGNGEKNASKKKSKAVIADVFESFLGALYIDLGLSEVKKFIFANIIPIIEGNGLDIFNDYKSQLQEYVQADKKSLEYVVVNENGPAHDKTFEVIVKIDDIIYGKGKAKSKKEAEQNAAYDALKKARKE